MRLSGWQRAGGLARRHGPGLGGHLSRESGNWSSLASPVGSGIRAPRTVSPPRIWLRLPIGRRAITYTHGDATISGHNEQAAQVGASTGLDWRRRAGTGRFAAPFRSFPNFSNIWPWAGKRYKHGLIPDCSARAERRRRHLGAHRHLRRSASLAGRRTGSRFIVGALTAGSAGSRGKLRSGRVRISG